MIYRILLAFVALLSVLACGGASSVLGTSSRATVDVIPRNGAQPTDFLVFISPDDGGINSSDCLSTTQDQQWGTRIIDGAMQRYTWVTITDDVPYGVWIASADGQPHDYRISIRMENVEMHSRDGTATNNAVREARVYRNSVDPSP